MPSAGGFLSVRQISVVMEFVMKGRRRRPRVRYRSREQMMMSCRWSMPPERGTEPLPYRRRRRSDALAALARFVGCHARHSSVAEHDITREITRRFG